MSRSLAGDGRHQLPGAQAADVGRKRRRTPERFTYASNGVGGKEREVFINNTTSQEDP